MDSLVKEGPFIFSPRHDFVLFGLYRYYVFYRYMHVYKF